MEDEDEKPDRDSYEARRSRRLAKEREEARRLAEGFDMMADDDSDDDQ